MNWLEQKWEYGVREDESLWMSIGDPKIGPHFQFDFHGDEELAKLICFMPVELTRTKRALGMARQALDLPKSKHHLDTCSHELISGYDCDCGLLQRVEALAAIKKELGE